MANSNQFADHAQTLLSGLLSNRPSEDVRSFGVHGAALSSAPVPVMALNPTNTPGSSPPRVRGAPSISIWEGLTTGIKMNLRALGKET